MVDLSFLRRKRRRKTVALIGAISSACAIIIGAVAALGQHAAPLTIKLSDSNAAVGLKTKYSEKETKSFLIAENAPAYTETEEAALPSDELLDNELSSSKLTGDGTSTVYYKYTFFVENVGDTDSDYEVMLSVNRQSSNTKEFDLTNILRVRFYENIAIGNPSEETHNNKTYAKSKVENRDGVYQEVPEPISKDPNVLAEQFESSKTILRSTFKGLKPNQVIRYTFVLWLEGYDADSEGKRAPSSSSLSLGVDISAHESEAKA